jgi:hypothetical protein|tara:strand:+ start:1798 stop:2667 length:870 start_codon:yes stop_codon:yes gene_type:complete
MSLTELDTNRDVVLTDVETRVNWTINSATAAQSRSIATFVMEGSSSSYLVNAQGTTTTTPLSSAFRHISNYYFSSTAGATIPVAQNNVATTPISRVVQIGRTTLDDGILSGSVTAVMSFGVVGNLTFTDIPQSSITGSIGRKGDLIETNDTTNIVGTVFYDTGTMVFHGGDASTNFLVTSSSGFLFGPGATAGNVAINSLSFKTISNIKRSSFFCRAFNKEFNYTNNSTAVADTALGSISASLTGNPVTFITTVGLYNDGGDLIAVAKVSPPVKKTFDTEKTFSVRLQY